MRSFEFRLERAFQWQQKQRKMAEEEVRLSTLSIAETDERIAKLTSLRAAADQDVIGRQTVTAADLFALAQFRQRVKRDAAALAKIRFGQLRVLELQRGRLTAEERRERQLEKLRGRAMAEYKRELDREIEAVASECHLAKWIAESGSTRTRE